MDAMYNNPWEGAYARRRLTPAVKSLLMIMGGVFLVNLLLARAVGDLFLQLFALSIPGLKAGFLWQPLTYIFMHANVVHLLLNGLVLFFIGPETERSIGTRQFYALFLLSGILGGLGWVVITNAPWTSCIGASGAVFGVIGAFAALYPDRPVTLLVFFILPVTMKAWVLALVLGLMELMYMLQPGTGGGIAYSAHLAGGIAGYLYACMAFRGGEPIRGLFRMFRARGNPRGWRVLRGGRDKETVLQDEVDRILDKIAFEGMSSLTRSERETLARASRRRD